MFQRQPLRDQIQTEILARIVDGRLATGMRINETHLAEDLGLSRTPLREAMLTLTASGFLASTMGRGFDVPAMSALEFGNIQNLLLRLEPHALGLTGLVAPTRVMELDNLLTRAKMRLGKSPMGQEQAAVFAELVCQWSQLTVGDVPNVLLAGEIRRLQGLSRRYWHALCRRELALDAILGSYAGIYEALRSGQREQACSLTETHMRGMAQAGLALLSGTTPEP